MHTTRTIFKLAVALLAIAILIGTALAGPGGSETKGRFYFKKTCKSCHSKGGEGGEITPLSKTTAQWKVYFTSAKHGKAKDPLSKVMPADQLLDVATYLQAHASDSPQPETCGK